MKKITALILIFLSVCGFSQTIDMTCPTNTQRLIDTSNYNFNYLDNYVNSINVVELGAIGDGATDNRQAFQDAIDSAISKGVNSVFVPIGDYLISSGSATALTFTSGNIEIIGESEVGSIIRTTSNTSIFYVLNRDRVSFKNLTFYGTGKDAVGANQRAIYYSGNIDGFTVFNCTFYDFSQSGVRLFGNGCCLGGSINTCRFFDNNVGVQGLNAGEYINILGCQFNGNDWGFLTNSGNHSFTNCQFTENDIGLEFQQGGNDSHSSIVGCLINHQLTWGIKIDSITKGLTFTGNQIFANDVILNESEGVVFNDNDMGSADFYFAGSLGTIIADNTFNQAAVLFTQDYLGKTSYTRFSGNTYSDNSNFIKGIFRIQSSTTTDTAFVITNKAGTIVFGVLDNGTTF